MNLRSYFGPQELPPIVEEKDLRFGDIIFCHPNEEVFSGEATYLGAFIGHTALGAIILMNLQDWGLFQQDKSRGGEMRISTCYLTFEEGKPDLAFITRKLGTFCQYILPAKHDRLIPSKE